MAAKKRKLKKKAGKKANPLVVLKTKLNEVKAQVKSVKAEVKETAKRADALVKDLAGTSAAPAAKKAKKTKKRRKKKAAKKK
ncbi:hypothetical protein MNBD_GAMMA08-1590 [hydrothermal vent metagenome]|uniref:Uncharacterized protein n=1 Tax=hydrothermal vent metagenome TaxID=652676 RepID=A0A3B0X8T0_9ZZZZ